MIGHNDQANHQYTLTDLWNAIANGNLPTVTFIKASAVNTGHPSTSSPLAEQAFLVETINALQKSAYWNDMAIIVAYDDSDGWYDHVMPPIVSPSADSANDTLAGAGVCGQIFGFGLQFNDRCGYGPRLPFLVISPFAKQNYVDHAVTDQTSILRFIEDNWSLGRIGNQSLDVLAGSILGHFDFTASHPKPVILDPTSGEVVTRANQ